LVPYRPTVQPTHHIPRQPNTQKCYTHSPIPPSLITRLHSSHIPHLHTNLLIISHTPSQPLTQTPNMSPRATLTLTPRLPALTARPRTPKSFSRAPARPTLRPRCLFPSVQALHPPRHHPYTPTSSPTVPTTPQTPSQAVSTKRQDVNILLAVQELQRSYRSLRQITLLHEVSACPLPPFLLLEMEILLFTTSHFYDTNSRALL
jgi:hypothetical protein